MFDFDKVNEVLETKQAEPKKRLGTILVVDDEPENVKALERLLANECHVFGTTEPKKALEIYEKENIDLIISDQRITCINRGLLYRYLVKPWHPEELISVIKQAFDQLKKDRMIKKLIPQQVISRLYDGVLEDASAGDAKEVECCILFLDIRGFTTLVETMEPRDVFAFLTSYVTTLAPVVQGSHGYIDKYLGDGLMAIFDRPGSFCEDALKCAIQLIEATFAYNDTNRSELIPAFRAGGEIRHPLRVGISINIGKVMLGAIGSKSRMEFTVLGDAVNVAARIEELTKTFGIKIICHEDVAKASPNVATRRIGKVSLRGKQEKIAVYDVFDTDDRDLVELKQSYQKEFEEIVGRLLEDTESDIDKVQEAFYELFDKHPYDPILREMHVFMKNRKQALIVKKPSLALRSV